MQPFNLVGCSGQLSTSALRAIHHRHRVEKRLSYSQIVLLESSTRVSGSGVISSLIRFGSETVYGIVVSDQGV